jgi:hypothetical protein
LSKVRNPPKARSDVGSFYKALQRRGLVGLAPAGTGPRARHTAGGYERWRIFSAVSRPFDPRFGTQTEGACLQHLYPAPSIAGRLPSRGGARVQPRASGLLRRVRVHPPPCRDRLHPCAHALPWKSPSHGGRGSCGEHGEQLPRAQRHAARRAEAGRMRAAGGGTRAPRARGRPSLARRREQRRRRRRGQISILATSLAISALTSTLATSLATTALATAARAGSTNQPNPRSSAAHALSSIS